MKERNILKERENESEEETSALASILHKRSAEEL